MIKRITAYLNYRFERYIASHLYNSHEAFLKIIQFLLNRIFRWNLYQIKNHDAIFEYFDNLNQSLFYTRKSRVLRYKNGINSKLDSLQKEYLTYDLTLTENSVIIDIGANIGEFSKFWEDRNFNVISFEPEPLEFKALQKNLTSKSLFNTGLWHENCTIKLYHANETGDSSFIESNAKDAYSELEVKTLDSFNLYKNHTIGLIKLEAEGAEPEIINGGLETFKKARYVTCDVGLERGVNSSSTLVEVTNLLTKLGFELIRFNPKRYIIVFANSDLIKRGI